MVVLDARTGARLGTAPIGEGADGIHGWIFETAGGQRLIGGDPGDGTTAIDDDLFAAMKPGVQLINVARGPIIVDAALRRALFMPLSEQHRRMKQMRRAVREYNVYRWSAECIKALIELE